MKRIWHDRIYLKNFSVVLYRYGWNKMGLKAVIPLEIRNSQFSKFSGIADEMDCVFTVSIITRREYDLVTREADAALCLTLLFQSVLYVARIIMSLAKASGIDRAR